MGTNATCGTTSGKGLYDNSVFAHIHYAFGLEHFRARVLHFDLGVE